MREIGDYPEPHNHERETKDYEGSRYKYIEKYGGDLDKPSENLKVSVIIPTFAELNSDNFWRLFRSLMYQRGVRQDEFEVIVVVNNSAEIANNPASVFVARNQFEGTTGDLRVKRYRENQDHLEIMKIAKTAQKMIGQGEKAETVTEWIGREIDDRSLEVSDYERRLLVRFAETDISLQFVDASSPARGFDTDPNVSPIGLARDIGSYFAYDRFKGIGFDGMVDFIDGDCFFEPNYIRCLVNQLESDVDVVVKPLRKVVAEIPRGTAEHPNRFVRVMSTVQYLAGVLSSREYTSSNLDMFDSDTIGYPIYGPLGGPQMTVRAHVLPDVGGYPSMLKNSDFAFSEYVLDRYEGGQVGTLTESSVLMSDRGRDVSIDGRARLKLVHEKGSAYLSRESIDLSSNGTLRSLRDNDYHLRHELKVIANLGKYSLQELTSEYETIMDRVYHREADRRIFTIEKIGHLLELIISQKMEKLQPSEIIAQMYRQQQIGRPDADFFQQNMVLVELAVDALAMSEFGGEKEVDIAQGAMKFLRGLLPEYFEVPPETRPEVANFKDGDNLANYHYVSEAIYLMKAKLRERLLREGKGK